MFTRDMTMLKKKNDILSQMIIANQQDLRRKDEEISLLKLNRQALSKRATNVGYPSIFFTAENSGDINGIGDNQVIKFNYVVSNEGNGYDKATGIFTAKVPGVYIFFFQIRGNTSHQCLVELVKHGERLVPIWITQNTADSSMAAYRLQAGDTVWLRNSHYNGNGCSVDDLSTFSGFLLHQ